MPVGFSSREIVIGCKRPVQLRLLIRVGFFRTQGYRGLELRTRVSRLDNWSVWSCGHDYCHDYRHDRNSVHKKKTKVDHNYQSLWTRPYYSLLLFRFILF
ncbi:hypothetical protein V6Z11_D02G087500 [Gossypium hirsutum]